MAVEKKHIFLISCGFFLIVLLCVLPTMPRTSEVSLLKKMATSLCSPSEEKLAMFDSKVALSKKFDGPDIKYEPDMIETTRLSALTYMRKIYEKGFKILDFGGATQGHLHYAHTVADLLDHSAWYRLHFPKTRFIPHADVKNKLPISDNEFDYVWTSHVAEHVPDPQQFCTEMTRISKYGGVVCVPRPLADNLIEPLKDKHKYGHKWWIFYNETHLQFMPRQKLLIHAYQDKFRDYNNFMRNFFGGSWEMCVYFKKPLQCDIIETMFENWSSDNILPLKHQKPQSVQLSQIFSNRQRMNK